MGGFFEKRYTKRVALKWILCELYTKRALLSNLTPLENLFFWVTEYWEFEVQILNL